jgi:hypothetical protein
VTDADRRTYQDVADLAGSHGAEVAWFEPAPSEPTAPVSASEQQARVDRAVALAEAVGSLDGVELVPVLPPDSPPGRTATDDDVLVAAARLAEEVGSS